MLFIAYEVLSNAKKRKNYDLYGEEGIKNQHTGPSFNFNFNDFFKRDTIFGGFNFDNIFNMFEEEDSLDDEGIFDEFSPFGNMDGFGFGRGTYSRL